MMVRKGIERAITAVAATCLFAAPALAANSLDVNAGAALEGDFGLEVIFDGADNNDDAYVGTDTPEAETSYRFSFLIDPSNISMAAKKYVLIGNIIKTDPPQKNFLFVFLRRSGNGQFYEIQTNVRGDNGAFQPYQVPVKICGNPGTTIPCSSAVPVKFEIQWKAATAPGANDGEMLVLKNGQVKKTFANLDNDTHTVDAAQFGTIFTAGQQRGGISGSYAFDSFQSFR